LSNDYLYTKIFRMSNIEKLKKTYLKKLNADDLDLIIALVIKKGRSFVISHPEYTLSEYQSSKINLLIKRRVNNEPYAYLNGKKEFYGLNFFVNKNTLIPRPETELMVDNAINILNNKETYKNTALIDMGTGSGCIIIALADYIYHKSPIKYFTKIKKMYAIDISLPALAIAKKNATLHKLNTKIKFLKGNLLEPIIDHVRYLNPLKNSNLHLIITANLPYLTYSQFKKAPSIQSEPKIALLAGQDGLKYYKKLFKQIKFLRRINKNLRLSLLCEIDSGQLKKIKTIIKKKIPQINLQIKKDLRGLDRLIIIEF